MLQDTAIIYFSRLPGEETIYKTFCGGNARVNKIVAEKLYAHTKNETVKTGLPVFYYSEVNQRGNTFGEKIATAFKDVFLLGFKSAIALGSDTPALTATQILEAAAQLENNTYVAGPTQLGGCYLFGLQKKVFCEQSIQDLKWQSASLQDSIKKTCTETFFLGSLREINSEGHLRSFLYNSNVCNASFASFINIIKSYLHRQFVIYSANPRYNNIVRSTSFGRAP